MQLIYLYLFTFLTGYLLALFFRLTLLEKIGLSCFLGSAWLTLWLFILSCLGNIPFSSSLIVYILTFSCIGLGLLVWWSGKRSFCWPQVQRFWQQPSRLEKILIVSLITICFFTLVENWIWPITDWDSIAFYDFRAKIIVATGFIQGGQDLNYFFGYPPYTSFLHAASYVFGISQSKVWYSWIYASFLLVFFAVLRKKVGRARALLGTLIVATQPLFFDHAMIAYTNLAYVAFLTLGIIYLWQWWERSCASDLVLGILLITLSTWVRLAEPFWIVGVLLVAANIWRKRKQWMIGVGCLVLLWIGKSMWPTYIARFDTLPNAIQVTNATKSVLPTSQSSGSLLLSIYQKLVLLFPSLITFRSYEQALFKPPQVLIQHFVAVASYLNFAVLPVFGWVLIPFTFALIANLQKKDLWKANYHQWVTIFLLLGMVWLGTYIFSFLFETWDQIGGSAARMTMFVPSLMVFVIMQSNLWQPIFQNDK